MRYVDTAATVVAGGITGSVGILPPSSAVETPPIDESVWFVPDGWPDWTGTWIEPDTLHSVEEHGRGGD